MPNTRTIGFSKASSFDFYRKKKKREQLLLLATILMLTSLIVIFAAILQYRVAGAAQIILPEETSAMPHLAGNTTIYTASKYIRAGSQISNLDFQEVYWPRSVTPEGAVRDPSSLVGKYAKNDIPAGTPIQAQELVSEKRFVSLPITPGMRAVTIEVDSQSSLEGWAQPGTRVDVTLTYVQGEGLTSKVIVQNAKVLSYAGDSRSMQERFGGAQKGYVEAGRTITLEVSPGDALKIQTSRRIGSLSLLMRAPEDDRSARVLEVDRKAIDTSFQSQKIEKQCKKGTMRVGKQNYIVDCDGNLSAFGDM